MIRVVLSGRQVEEEALFGGTDDVRLRDRAQIVLMATGATCYLTKRIPLLKAPSRMVPMSCTSDTLYTMTAWLRGSVHSGGVPAQQVRR